MCRFVCDYTPMFVCWFLYLLTVETRMNTYLKTFIRLVIQILDLERTQLHEQRWRGIQLTDSIWPSFGHMLNITWPQAKHSLTHCCAWPAEGRSVLHIERSWPAIQAAPTDRPMSSSTCCSQFLCGNVATNLGTTPGCVVEYCFSISMNTIYLLNGCRVVCTRVDRWGRVVSFCCEWCYVDGELLSCPFIDAVLVSALYN